MPDFPPPAPPRIPPTPRQRPGWCAALALVLTLSGALATRAADAPTPAPAPANPAAPAAPAATDATPEELQARATIEAAQRAREEAAAANLRLADNAFRLANGLYRREAFRLAAEKYESLIKDFPTFPQRAEALFYLGESYRVQNQNEAAMVSYTALRTQYPTHPITRHANLNAASLLIQANQYQAAFDLLDALDTHVDDPTYVEAVYYHRGLCLTQLGRDQEAARAYQNLVDLPLAAEFPYRLHARLSLAYLKRHLDDDAGAAPLFTELADSPLAPEAIRQDALYQLGDLAYRAGRYDDAINAFTRLLKDYPTATSVPAARLNLAWAQLMLKHFREVLDIFKDVPGQAPFVATDESLYLECVSLMELHLYEPALAKLKALAEGFPASPYARFADEGTVQTLYNLGRPADCIREAQRILAAQPDHPAAKELTSLIGRSQVNLQDWPAVVTTYEAALEKYWTTWDGREDALLILADAYARLKQPDKAAATYKRLLTIASASRRPAILMYVADASMRAGNNAEAAADLQTLLDTYPDSEQVPLALLHLCGLHSDAQKYAEGVALMDRFLKDFPGHELTAKALYLRGTLHFRLDHREEAIRDLAAAAELDFAERDYARLYLAYALWEDGKQDDALAHFAKLLKNPKLTNDMNPDMLVAIAARFLERNDVNAAEETYALLAASEKSGARLEGLIGLGLVALQREQYEKAGKAFADALPLAGESPAVRARVLVLSGEVYRLSGRTNEALIAFEDATRLGLPDMRSGALANFGMAQILLAKGERKQAMSFATSAFVLYDDPVSSPQAMMLAIQLSLDDKRPDDARIFYKELARKYPVPLGAMRNQPRYTELFKQLGPPE